MKNIEYRIRQNIQIIQDLEAGHRKLKIDISTLVQILPVICCYLSFLKYKGCVYVNFTIRFLSQGSVMHL